MKKKFPIGKWVSFPHSRTSGKVRKIVGYFYGGTRDNGKDYYCCWLESPDRVGKRDHIEGVAMYGGYGDHPTPVFDNQDEAQKYLDDKETESERKNGGCCDEDVETATAEVDVKEDKKEETPCDGQIDEGLMDFLKHPIQTIKDQYAKYIDNKQWEEITKKAKEVGAQGVKAASQKIVSMLKSNEHAKLMVKSGSTNQPIGAMCMMQFKGVNFLCITQKGNNADAATLDTLEQVLKGGVAGDGKKPIKKFTQGVGAILFLSAPNQKDGNAAEGKLIKDVEETSDGIVFVPGDVSMGQQKDDVSKAELFS
jgi:hypothetical protein